jgi:hypothetical protein
MNDDPSSARTRVHKSSSGTNVCGHGITQRQRPGGAKSGACQSRGIASNMKTVPTNCADPLRQCLCFASDRFFHWLLFDRSLYNPTTLQNPLTLQNRTKDP